MDDKNAKIKIKGFNLYRTIENLLPSISSDMKNKADCYLTGDRYDSFIRYKKGTKSVIHKISENEAIFSLINIANIYIYGKLRKLPK